MAASSMWVCANAFRRITSPLSLLETVSIRSIKSAAARLILSTIGSLLGLKEMPTRYSPSVILFLRDRDPVVLDQGGAQVRERLARVSRRCSHCLQKIAVIEILSRFIGFVFKIDRERPKHLRQRFAHREVARAGK